LHKKKNGSSHTLTRETVMERADREIEIQKLSVRVKTCEWGSGFLAVEWVVLELGGRATIVAWRQQLRQWISALFGWDSSFHFLWFLLESSSDFVKKKIWRVFLARTEWVLLRISWFIVRTEWVLCWLEIVGFLFGLEILDFLLFGLFWVFDLGVNYVMTIIVFHWMLLCNYSREIWVGSRQFWVMVGRFVVDFLSNRPYEICGWYSSGLAGYTWILNLYIWTTRNSTYRLYYSKGDRTTEIIGCFA